MQSIDHRVLTVREPYASLLTHRLKRFETRTQPTAYRGLVFVLAGKATNDTLRAVGEANRWRLRAVGADAGMDPQWFAKLPRAAIVGAARLTACRQCLDVIEEGELTADEESVGHWADEHFAWQMDDAVVFKTPVPCRGQLGLTHLKDDVLARAMVELGESCDDPLFNLLTSVRIPTPRSRVLKAIEADLSVAE